MSSSLTMSAGFCPTPSIDLLKAIRRFRVVGNVLCIAAHPDDENTRLLSWLVHGEGVRAAYLSLTRGEGGQNLIGPERAPLLGLIRAQELLAARRIDGAEQFFGSQTDFGYSKSREETLAVWNQEQALGEIVHVIRLFKPDVILTRFAPDEHDTHGHHTTSALLAVEAFAAAGDPNQFPEQLETLSPWQATRVAWNWFSLDVNAAPDLAAGFMPIDIGGYDPLIGESYPELAARSLTMHKTQGFGSAGTRGPAREYFRVLAGGPMLASLFDGIDRTWARVPGGADLMPLLAKIEAEFSLDRPHASVPALLDALAALAAMPAHPWREYKMRALSEIIAGCAALSITARTGAGQVMPGSAGPIAVDVIARSPLPVTIRGIHVRSAGRPAAAITADTNLARNVSRQFLCDFTWPEARGEADAAVMVDAAIDGRSFALSRQVVHAWTDPILGERWEPVTVVPPVTINPQTLVLVCPGDGAQALRVRVRGSCGGARGLLRAVAPDGVVIDPPEALFEVACAGAEQVLTFVVRHAVSGVLRFVLDGAPACELIRLEYPHIPPITVTRAAEVKLVRVNLARGGTRVGYVAGAGDEVAQSLRQVGYEVTTLSEDTIESGALSDFDAIVTGVRAFNTSRRLGLLMPRLLAYAEAGGTLVVQYNTGNAAGGAPAALGPYPFTIGDDRVCEENAEVRMTDPAHPIFTSPNLIEPADFSGWVQERGLCFSSSWDTHYTSLISTHDSGQAAQQGGLLVASHGAGRVVYTGLAFFRQLPAGVPGAFRLFANLLAR